MYRKSCPPPYEPQEAVKKMTLKEKLHPIFYSTTGYYKGEMKIGWFLLFTSIVVCSLFAVIGCIAVNHHEKELRKQLEAPCSSFEESIIKDVPAHCLRELMLPKK